MVLKQHRDSDDVLIIDASKGYVKDGKNNKLRACDIKRIADTIRARKPIPGFSRVVSRGEIRQNGYNLNIPRYVDSSEATEQYDIYATMFGGIPESEINQLQTYWNALPSLRADLFQPKEDGSPYATVKSEDIAKTIEENTDVCNLKQTFANAFSDFADTLHSRLITNVSTVKEMNEQDDIANDIFNRLKSIPLIDKYVAYQALSDNWQAIVNDIETIQSEGIDAVRVVEQAYKLVKKGDEEIEVPDGLKGRIIPFELVQHEKFQTELDAINVKQTEVEDIASQLDELRDGFTEEERQTYLDEDDDTKFNKNAIKSDAKIKGDEVEQETKVKLKEIVNLWDKTAKLNKEIKADKATLELHTINTIEHLSDEDVEMFLHKKWINPVCDGINGALSAIFSALEKSVMALEAKYALPYNEVERNIANSQEELSKLINQLTGDKFAIKGLQEFLNKLKD